MKCQEEILYDYLHQCQCEGATSYSINSTSGVTTYNNDDEYLEPMITAAEYLDDIDMYVDERPTAIVEVDNSAGPWVYYKEWKIPNIDRHKKTHKQFGFVGRLPGLKRKKY